MRIRQIAFVTDELQSHLRELAIVLGIKPHFTDDLSHFGLENSVIPIGKKKKSMYVLENVGPKPKTPIFYSYISPQPHFTQTVSSSLTQQFIPISFFAVVARFGPWPLFFFFWML